MTERRLRATIDGGPELLARKLDQLAARKANLVHIACPHARRVAELEIELELDKLRESNRVLFKIRHRLKKGGDS